MAALGGALAVGAVLGAGIALLSAPQSGAHTRLALGDQFRRHRPWRRSPWDRLGDELARATQRRNKRIRAETARG